MTWRYPCEEVGDCHGPMVSISHAELSFFVLSLSMKHEAWTNYADARVKHDYGQTSSVTEMMQSLHWRSLDQRRIDNKLSLMYKITHNLIAIPISDFLIPRVRPSRHYHPLSNRLITATTDYYNFSFFTRAVFHWNNLPLETVVFSTLEQFKQAVCKLDHVSP